MNIDPSILATWAAIGLQLIGTIVGLIVVSTRKDEKHQIRGDDHEGRIAELETKLDQAHSDLVELKTDVKWIRRALEKQRGSELS